MRALVNGAERQNYPVSDMLFFAPAEIVSLLSHDMTLEAGNIVSQMAGN